MCPDRTRIQIARILDKVVLDSMVLLQHYWRLSNAYCGGQQHRAPPLGAPLWVGGRCCLRPLGHVYSNARELIVASCTVRHVPKRRVRSSVTSLRMTLAEL